MITRNGVRGKGENGKLIEYCAETSYTKQADLQKNFIHQWKAAETRLMLIKF